MSVGAADLLADARWECISTAPGAIEDPTRLDEVSGDWLAAQVPGTAAAAMRGARGLRAALTSDYDALDWWFRCRFPVESRLEAGSSSWVLELEGLATLADVWLNGAHLLQSETMFVPHSVSVPELAPDNTIAIRFAALTPALGVRRPRPRWRTRLVRDQNLRWYRTTLLGRMPGWSGFAAPVGPWRPVTLKQRAALEVVSQRRSASVVDGVGLVDVRVVLRSTDNSIPALAELRVGDFSATADLTADGEFIVARCRLELPAVELWWPHTHGKQPRYPVRLVIGGHEVDLGFTGFRNVDVDHTRGQFSLLVNGQPVFCRGVCWVSPDVLSLNPSYEELRGALLQLRAAGLNMVRVTGTTVYESQEFWDICDELGIMVWFDAMFATLDVPEEPVLVAEIQRELDVQLTRIQGCPSLVIVCGGSETEQQAIFVGLRAERRRLPLLEKTIADIAADLLPGIPYLSSSPGASEPSVRIAEGVSHYFGVGAYLRSLSDVITAGVRFASECLAFSVPPEKSTVDEVFSGATMAGHHPDWKAAVPRDNSASWDFEDVRNFYVHEVFGVDPLLVRYADPERALDLGRAALAYIFASAFAIWRIPTSGCGGALVLAGRDLIPGAGWGIVDALGRPKSTWYALKRTVQPVSVLLTDRGLDGIAVHIVNDSDECIVGSLTVDVFDRLGNCADSRTVPVSVDERGAWTAELTSIFDEFRDFNYAYRFGAATYDVIRASLDGGGGVCEAIYLPLGQARPMEADVGLHAVAMLDGDLWTLEIKTKRLAQWVSIDVPGFLADDSWFHIAPTAIKRVALTRIDDRTAEPAGYVRALNSYVQAPVLASASAAHGARSSR